MAYQKSEPFIIYHNEKELLSVKGDIYLLHVHLDFIKEQISKSQSKIEEFEKEFEDKREKQLLEEVDEISYRYSLHTKRMWFENGFHRMIINPFIVSTYSVFESVLKDFADLLREAKGVEKKIEDVKGKYFFAKIEKYYEKYLETPLKLNDDQKDQLKMLNNIRNAIVHNFGNLAGLPESLQKNIRSGKTKGIKIDEPTNKFVLDTDIAEHYFKVVRSSLLSLLNDYQEI